MVSLLSQDLAGNVDAGMYCRRAPEPGPVEDHDCRAMRSLQTDLSAAWRRVFVATSKFITSKFVSTSAVSCSSSFGWLRIPIPLITPYPVLDEAERRFLAR